ncbi:hypothetical protein A374_08889 [Fictibacillus macauensis ZFHKF-1]|uniref:Uncharacterized protein n=1 Tax=Fictibacillus macauensis ZFHKF-1 TaxID=1196324 RepID=I8AK52_9BACL|nr:hypothetical protein [Fictibacillus macauensis]EIT85939.1 hypothetical protein A374_08889 [Fictibacillus macauensis ZFHKF-1]
MTIEMNVFFKMMQKDDKKEVLKFEIKGNEDEQSGNDVFVLSGSIVVFTIKGCNAGEVTAEFMNIQRDSKKTVLKFAIKGDSEKKAQELYKFAGQNVNLMIQPSQMSLDDFYEDNGPSEVEEDNPDQMSLDDIEDDEFEDFDTEEAFAEENK